MKMNINLEGVCEDVQRKGEEEKEVVKMNLSYEMQRE